MWIWTLTRSPNLESILGQVQGHRDHPTGKRRCQFHCKLHHKPYGGTKQLISLTVRVNIFWAETIERTPGFPEDPAISSVFETEAKIRFQSIKNSFKSFRNTNHQSSQECVPEFGAPPR